MDARTLVYLGRFPVEVREKNAPRLAGVLAPFLWDFGNDKRMFIGISPYADIFVWAVGGLDAYTD